MIEKPLIRKSCIVVGAWCCGFIHEPGSLTGYGASPKQAYEDWLLKKATH